MDEQKLQLTKEEKELVINELAERMKDMVYMNAKVKAREVVEQALRMKLNSDEKVVVTYEFEFVFNDIIQIVGRRRRKRKDRWRSLTL